MIQLVFKGNQSVAVKLAQRIRRRSPLMQEAYIRKINRQARGVGENDVSRERALPSFCELWERIAGLERGMLTGCEHNIPPLRAGRRLRMNAVIGVSLPTTSLSGGGGAHFLLSGLL